MMARRDVPHSDIVALARSTDQAERAEARRYLEDLADEFTADEVWAVLTLIDTPDVFD